LREGTSAHAKRHLRSSGEVESQEGGAYLRIGCRAPIVAGLSLAADGPEASPSSVYPPIHSD